MRWPLVALCLCALAFPLCAQRNGRPPTDSLSQRYPRSRALLAALKKSDPETYRAVLAAGKKLEHKERKEAVDFVATHHPALGRVLEGLRKRSPKAYENGVSQIVRDLRRLRRRVENDPASEKEAIRRWRERSQMRLRAARLVKKEDEGAFLARVRRTLLEEEKARRLEMTHRLERLESQIEVLRRRLAVEPEATVERMMRRWKQSIRKGRTTRRGKRAEDARTGGRKR